MRIIFFGTPHFVLPVLDALSQHHDVVGVVTTQDAIVGRKKVLTPTPVKAHFLKLKPKGHVFTPEEFNSDVVQKLQNLNPDLFVVAAYGKIIPKEVLEIPTYDSINIHPSLLPMYRGPSPIQQTILDGLAESGATIIQMDEEIDHGPILAVEKVAVAADDTFQSLHDKMFDVASDLVIKTIEQFNNSTIHPVSQDHTKATYCPHITRESGYFDIENPPGPIHLDRMIRAYYPWPTAYTKLKMKNETLKIVKFLPEKQIQVEGGRPMSIKDFLNGYPEFRDIITRLFVNRIMQQ